VGVHAVQVEAARAHWNLHVRHHVLDVTRPEGKGVPGDALAQQVRDKEGRVNALVPRATAGHDQLPAGKQQGGAVRLVETHRDGGKLGLVVKREGQHAVYAIQVQHLQGRQNLRGRHDVVNHGEGLAVLQKAAVETGERAVLAFSHGW
jgi:hypothetical protein